MMTRHHECQGADGPIGNDIGTSTGSESAVASLFATARARRLGRSTSTFTWHGPHQQTR
jgi:hypothetical protein